MAHACGCTALAHLAAPGIHLEARSAMRCISCCECFFTVGTLGSSLSPPSVILGTLLAPTNRPTSSPHNSSVQCACLLLSLLWANIACHARLGFDSCWTDKCAWVRTGSACQYAVLGIPCKQHTEMHKPSQHTELLSSASTTYSSHCK